MEENDLNAQYHIRNGGGVLQCFHVGNILGKQFQDEPYNTVFKKIRAIIVTFFWLCFYAFNRHRNSSDTQNMPIFLV